MMKSRKFLVLAGALVTATLALSACASSGTNPETGSSTAAQSFNESDVEFAQMMVPHHEGAIDMSQVVLDREGIDPRVTDLAERIQAAQGPEIDQLGEWLDAWGADDGMSGMDQGMGGEMSDDDMTALEAATGVEASRLFLEQMTVHHQGAIDMAQAELDNGENPEAQAMAQQIIDAQESEIGEMREILATL